MTETIMRTATRFLLVLALAVPATAARAQVQQNNPNAANESLARQSDMRALQQSRTADFNLLNMQAQRNVQYRPVPPGGRFIGPYRGGFHRGAARVRGGGLNTSVCVGC